MKKTEKKQRIARHEILQKVYAYIKSYHDEHEGMPSLTDIGNEFGHNRQWAWYYVSLLAESGKIKIQKYKSRGILIA